MRKYVIIALILLVIAGFFIVKNAKSSGNVVKEQVREFKLDATRFQYSPDRIEVNKGDKIRIIINNIDTIHGIRIPDFNVKDENSVEFIADKRGEFDFYCTVFCGGQHREMRGKLIVK